MMSAAPVARALDAPESSGQTDDPPLRTRYLELLKKALTDEIYADVRPGHEIGSRHGRAPHTLARNIVVWLLGRGGFSLVRRSDAGRRLAGAVVPLSAHTMIGRARLDHLQWCVETVLREDVPGDLLEAGVWRGGASILMRGVLAANGVTDRCVWLADSFMGLPAPNVKAFPADRGSWFHEDETFSVSLKEVKKNFATYDLLDEQVRFIPGWFKDTLASAPIEQIALLRLDADLYESTWQALAALYRLVSPGGIVVVDDYRTMDGCRRAVDDFRERNVIKDEIIQIADAADGVYWRRRT